MVATIPRRPASFLVNSKAFHFVSGRSPKLHRSKGTGKSHWKKMERSSHHNNSEPSNVIGTPNTDRTLPRPVPESATKTSERSAVVLALFGPSVGPCVGDFATTYNRVNGRLYAATRAILFYSNLFGFERRLCLQFSDIESIESYRSTSIRIAMVDCEDHIFRKFFNRDEVLRVLKDLYHQAGNSVTARVLPMGHFDMTPIRRTNQTEEDIDSMEDSQRGRLPSELSQSDTANESLESTLRPRSQSVPSLNRLITVQEKTKLDLSLRPRTFLKSLSTLSGGKVTPTNEPDRNPSEFNENDDSLSAFSVVVGPSAPPGFDMNKVWLEAKHPYSESALSVSQAME